MRVFPYDQRRIATRWTATFVACVILIGITAAAFAGLFTTIATLPSLVIDEDDPPAKTYTIERASAAPKIDGKLDDAVWAKAQVGDLGTPELGKKVKHGTRFRMLYDDERLYVAFEVTDPHVFSAAEKHDDPVFNGDCVELFLCTGDDPHYYYEIDISPTAQVWDALIVNTRGWKTDGGNDLLNRTPLKEYDCKGIDVKVQVHGIDGQPGRINKSAEENHAGKSWDVEVSIPLSQLPGGKNSIPKPGDQWRGNVYRIERPPHGEVQLQAYSPVLSLKFSRPARFAYLKFR